jgi:hypothetical protein
VKSKAGRKGGYSCFFLQRKLQRLKHNPGLLIAEVRYQLSTNGGLKNKGENAREKNVKEGMKIGKANKEWTKKCERGGKAEGH